MREQTIRRNRARPPYRRPAKGRRGSPSPAATVAEWNSSCTWVHARTGRKENYRRSAAIGSVTTTLRQQAESRRQSGREADQPRSGHHGIARGSGTSVQEVNHLLRQYAQMRKMFKSMGKPGFARGMAGMKRPGMV